jgi:16S rRNA (guanine966-N2)-methyltransferase
MQKKTNIKSELKIIGGELKSRKILFNSNNNSPHKIRPTPNRLRETLFNWLMHDIKNSHCIDLFAGSGILGFEAISRGAMSVLAYEINSDSINNIKKNRETLNIKSNKYKIINQNCLEIFKPENFINNKNNTIIFCDPPFNSDLLIKFCDLISKLICEHNDIYNNFLIYIECPAKLNNEQNKAIKKLKINWKLHKEKKCSDVHGLLFSKK